MMRLTVKRMVKYLVKCMIDHDPFRWLVLLFLITSAGCAPPAEEIRCIGPHPFTCESDCVTFCESFEGDTTDVFYVAATDTCVPSCWNRPDGGAR